MKVVLELQDQPSNVRRITVRHDIVIGRGSDCNLRLSAPQVSRRHCFLRVGRDSVSVTDLDSSNGTYVDGARIAAGKRYDIADGAQLALGPIRFIIHMRAEGVASDSAKSKMTAGVMNESLRAEPASDSVPRRAMAKDGSTVAGRSRIAESDVPMDYNMEQGGESAEPQEATANSLGGQLLATGLSELNSPTPDPMDSRLEIIDFGRRLAEESLSAHKSSAVTHSDVVGKSEKADEEEPQWESATVDSSDSPDDLDLLSIANDSEVESSRDREQTSEAEAPIDDSVDTIFPQPSADAAVPAQTYVVADDLMDVEVIHEILEVADEVLEEDEESQWFADDKEDVADVMEELDIPDDEVAADTVKSADDEIDPDLQSFLKGF
ncbi:MAG: FHA domain-containing protein [Planctomycetaceae bacterium]